MLALLERDFVPLFKQRYSLLQADTALVRRSIVPSDVEKASKPDGEMLESSGFR